MSRNHATKDLLLNVNTVDNRNCADLPERLLNAGLIGIDTEFMRERHYYPTLALLQLAVDNEIFLVDPLDYPGTDALVGGFSRPGVTRIMHSAGQDIEVLNCHSSTPLNGLFDTQIAASMLGIGDQISYAALVRELLGVELPKSETRTNWLRRPLSQAQLTYAADDVRHLQALHELLAEQLELRGRHEWLQQECDGMVARISAPIEGDQLLRKIKGQQDLDRDGLAVLRALAIWREQQAQKRNLPRGWLVSDPTLVSLASVRSANPDDYHRNHDDAAKLLAREADHLARLASEALALPDTEKPRPSSHVILSATQKNLLKKLRQAVQTVCDDERISAQLLCNRKDLENLILGERDVPLLRGWRNELAGEAVSRLL